MEFLWPSSFFLLLAIPLLIWVYVRAQRRRLQLTARYAELSLMKDVLKRAPGRRRHLPALLFLLGFIVMVTALARPTTTMIVASFERTVILTIDVSGSMRAEDLKPNRIEAAKAAARAFVEKQEAATRIGVVSFSAGAALVQAPTTDKTLVYAAINRLRTERATAIGSGILTSLDAIAEATNQDLPLAHTQVTPSAAANAPRTTRPAATPSTIAANALTPTPQKNHAPAIIVLLTDGQNTTGPLPLDAAQIAVNRTIRVYTIGIGTPQGATLGPNNFGGGGGPGAGSPGGGQPPPGGGFGTGGNGNAFGGGGNFGGFRAILDETTLKKIAEMTDAKYYYAANETDLRAIYESLDKQLVLKPQQIEVTGYVTAVAVGFALLSGILSLLWFGRLP